MLCSTADPLSNSASGGCALVPPAQLPDDPAVLKALLLEQQRAFEAREAELQKAFEARIVEIYEQLRLARRRMFGPSSESHAGQGWLFNEAEALVESAPEAGDAAALPSATETSEDTPADTGKKKARGKRKPLPVELPRIDVIHDVPEAERTCACGTPMVEIGQDVSEQLDIVPMQVRVLRHIRKRYGCPKGDQAPVMAPAPAQVLPKSNASNDSLALLLIIKYVDGLPLARFEYVLARAGVLVPRQTLARWVIGAARALQPIANLMRDVLLGHDVIHMDETPIQVLKEPGRSPTSTSQMWVQRGGPPGTPVILFEYDPSRAQAVPLRLLEGWKGHLMADGLESYGAISFCDGVTRLGCWAHARRRFVEASKVLPAGKRGRAHEALGLIGKLYAIEKACRELNDAERLAQRQTRSRAVLDELRRWLDQVLPTVPPSSVLGGALGYLHRQWPRLIRYIERGDLPVDNNPAENAIRPFVVGRNYPRSTIRQGLLATVREA
ncbi:IS66 family transposase [Aromatoleum anaerobium]|uniref:IS66 family transposase n=1 Tax=Aromatoleum anaerobium TaxID=182180 RepID=UPI001FF5EAC8|nr:IS66 family transposase [Aromatoleum anaerobium]MCK0508447.1 IS66 family transposase [Aromatoleum anaerobium]